MILFHRQIRQLREAYGHYVLRIVRVFFPIFTICYFFFITPKIIESILSTRYISTSGIVTDVSLDKSTYEQRTTWTIHVIYEFVVDNLKYISDRYDPFGDFKVVISGNDNLPAALLGKFKKGDLLSVWYDGNDPKRSLLSIGPENLQLHFDDILPLIFGIVTVIVVWNIPLKIPIKAAEQDAAANP